MYIRLLCTQWVNGSIPDDQRRIAKAAGVDLSELQREWHLLEPKFPICDDGMRRNPRLEGVRARQKEVSEVRKVAADTRWKSNANAYTKNMQRKVKEKIEVEEEKERTTQVEKVDTVFDAFYAAYPNKKAKGPALTAWAKLKATERALCRPAIEAQVKANHFRGADGVDYIPHPASWLNARRWEDEVKHTQRTKLEELRDPNRKPIFDKWMPLT